MRHERASILTLAQADGTPERASNITPRHYAQLAAASMPVIESPSARRRRPTVRPLRRPHNGRYVQCPPHGARAPRGGRSRDFFDRVASAFGVCPYSARGHLNRSPSNWSMPFDELDPTGSRARARFLRACNTSFGSPFLWRKVSQMRVLRRLRSMLGRQAQPVVSIGCQRRYGCLRMHRETSARQQ